MLISIFAHTPFYLTPSHTSACSEPLTPMPSSVLPSPHQPLPALPLTPTSLSPLAPTCQPLLTFSSSPLNPTPPSTSLLPQPLSPISSPPLPMPSPPLPMPSLPLSIPSLPLPMPSPPLPSLPSLPMPSPHDLSSSSASCSVPVSSVQSVQTETGQKNTTNVSGDTMVVDPINTPSEPAPPGNSTWSSGRKQNTPPPSLLPSPMPKPKPKPKPKLKPQHEAQKSMIPMLNYFKEIETKGGSRIVDIYD